MSEPNIIEESSSDEELTIPTINTGPSIRPLSPESQCPICLDGLTNPSHTDSCLHSFCFDCLRQWAHRKNVCPLCKATFSYVYHSFDAMGVHKTYVAAYTILSDEYSLDDDNDGNYRIRLNAEPVDSIISFPPIFGQEERIQVYSNSLWAEPTQLSDRIRDCRQDFYRNYPIDTQRLYLFILRYITAARECLELENQENPMVAESYLTISYCVIQSLFNFEIRQIHMNHSVMFYLDVHAVHFCHGLYNFGISPLDMNDYDANVEYTHRPPATESPEPLSTETIVLRSENEEVQSPMIDSDVSCNTDDSDDVYYPWYIKPLNPASVDQPSTSTGIRDSLNQPNNSDNDSDVEIMEHIVRPTLQLNSASVDQPSTSTGIRDSLNQPNNSDNDSDVEIMEHIVRPTLQLNSASVDQPSTSTGIRDSLNQPNNSDNDSDVEIMEHIVRPTQPLNSVSVHQPSTSTGIRDSLNQPNNSDNDSDVVIIEHIVRPTQPLNSVSVDQPSTSTGIRDSLNRPTNGFQSVDGGSSSYISRIKRTWQSLDSSSDDENSIIATRGSKTAHIKSLDINNKNKKKRKFIKKKKLTPKSPVTSEIV